MAEVEIFSSCVGGRVREWTMSKDHSVAFEVMVLMAAWQDVLIVVGGENSGRRC